MNSKSGQHDREHLDLVFLYALQALPSSEIPVVEAHICSCTDCRQEIETLRPIIGSFVSWPTDVLRPSVSLWGRLAQRIAEETGKEPLLPPSQPPAKQAWEEVAPGISWNCSRPIRRKTPSACWYGSRAGPTIRLTRIA